MVAMVIGTVVTVILIINIAIEIKEKQFLLNFNLSMKILQINQCHYPRGGADIVYLNHIKLLKEKGHDIAEFSAVDEKNLDSDYSEFFVKSSDLRKSSLLEKVLNIPSYLYNKEAEKKLKILIKNFKPDVAHVHLFYGKLSVSILKTLSDEKIPIVHTVHDYKILCPVNTLLDRNQSLCNQCVSGSAVSCIKKRCSDGSLLQSIMVAAEALIWKEFIHPIRFIDQYHFVSDFCKNEHEKYYPDLSNKSTKIYNYSPIKINFLKSKDYKKYFLYFGRLSREKGVMTLLKSWTRLSKKFKLLVVGDGHMKNDLIAYKELNKLNNVEFLGYKAGEDLYNLVGNALYVIVPSEWFENNPMTIIESYKLRTPVIGAAIGGIPEIIVSEKTGFTFRAGDSDSLSEIILKAEALDKNTYNSMMNNCSDFFEKNFSEKIYYESIINVYKTTIVRAR